MYKVTENDPAQTTAFHCAKKTKFNFKTEHELNEKVEGALRYVIYQSVYAAIQNSSDHRELSIVARDAVNTYLRERGITGEATIPNTAN